MKTFDHVCGIYMDHPRVLLTFGAVLSIMCIGIIFMLFYYYKIPNLRRHPTTITIHKCWFELIFVSQFLWIASVPHTFFWDEYSNDETSDCVTNRNIWPLAWAVQFTLLGGELWFAVLSIDIHQSLSNPFNSYHINSWYYTTFVYGLAILVATIFVSVVPIQYGLSVDPMIWVNDYNNSQNGRWTKFAVFYVFMIIIYMYCGVTAVWARHQIHKGLEETLAVRKYSISKQTRYVIGYFMFWTCVFVLQFLNYLNDADYKGVGFTNEELDHIRSASAFLLASRGIWSLGIFLVANWLEISTFFRAKRSLLGKADSAAAGTGTGTAAGGRAAPPQVEQEQVQLNIALQTEIVRFTVLGIQKAVQEAGETIIEQERLSTNASTNAASFFNRRTGDAAFSFIISDPDAEGSMAHSDSSAGSHPAGGAHGGGHGATAADAIAAASQSAPLDPERGIPTNSPLRHLHMVTEASAQLGGSMYQRDPSVLSFTPESRDLSYRSGSLFRKSEAVNFALHDDGTIRQASTSTDSVRSTHVSNNFINQLGNRIRQQLAPARGTRSFFMFTDYSPKQFAKMREISGITNEDYLRSFKSTTMPSFSEGRSGAFLYFSSDRKYIVKTTTKPEFEKLMQILPDYVNYFVQEIAQGHQPLVTRFLGAHKIIMYDIPLYFVIMQNICPSVQEKYDLKGSWVNRHSSKKKDYNPRDSRPKKFHIASGDDKYRPLNRRQDGAQLFLDNDLQNCFLLDPKVSKLLAEQVLRDIKMLAGFNLMDYSLLVGIKRRNFEVIDSAPNTPLVQSAGAGPRTSSITTANGSVNGGANASQSQAPPQVHSPVRGYSVCRSTVGTGLLANYRDADGAMHAAVVEGQGTFYIGIIDILQEWNYDKWYERMFKKYVLRKDADGLSAMDPLNYRKRFYQRAVLDVFDGLGLDEADDADIFDRYSMPVIPESERETIETVVSSARGRQTMSSSGRGGFSSTGHSGFDLSGTLGAAGKGSYPRDSDGELRPSENSSVSCELQLRSLDSGSVSASRESPPTTPLGTDKRFQVKTIVK